MIQLFKPLTGTEGQSLTEYGLMLAVFMVVVIGAVMILGPKILSLYTNANAKIN